MKSIYDRDKILASAERTKIHTYFNRLPGSLHMIEYEAGETISSAFDGEKLFQILIRGTAAIFCMREDGNIYSLAQCQEFYLLGDADLFFERSPHITVTAQTKCTCFAISIEQDGEELLNDIIFMRAVARELAQKLQLSTNLEAISSSLKERVMNYIRYYCREQMLSGVEKSAFHLHCSPRQLQRVLNELTAENEIRKIGKGKYVLQGELNE